MEKTSITISAETRNRLKVRAAIENKSYNVLLDELLDYLETQPFNKEKDVMKWIHENLDFFGLSKIEEINTNAFPDLIALDKEGKRLRIEVELVATNFIKHGHDPDKVDLIICAYSAGKTEISSVPIIALMDNDISHGLMIWVNLTDEELCKFDEHVFRLKQSGDRKASKSRIIKALLKNGGII